MLFLSGKPFFGRNKCNGIGLISGIYTTGGKNQMASLCLFCYCKSFMESRQLLCILLPCVAKIALTLLPAVNKQ